MRTLERQPRVSAGVPERPVDTPPSRAWYRRHWRLVLLGALVPLAALAGATLGYFLKFDLPDVRALQDYNPPQMTRVLAADRTELEQFAEQRRILIGFREIPLVFRQALLATEDANFERHPGVDAKALVRAAWRDLISMKIVQGGSTLTQQLASSLFLRKEEKTPRRKVQEAFLALEIERQYTKDEILRFYCNQIYMGHGRYGVEAASRFYFDKPARDLSLNEAATLAGLIQRPEALSPLRNPERSRQRRNLVLGRMAEVGFITKEEAARVRQEPIETRARTVEADRAPYFVEEVRRWLQEHYGSSGLYQEGLEVATTLDPRLQEIANRALDVGLRELDRRQGWRGISRRVPDGEDPLVWEAPDWERGTPVGEVRDGVVIGLRPAEARVRVGEYVGHLGPKEIEWTGKRDPRQLLHVGDLVRVRLVATGAGGSAELSLEQEPRVEAALVALDPATGDVRAMVGGVDFARSEYNRATQARRQTGSAFKPFVYAAALGSGWTLADPLIDEPTVFLDPTNPEPYQPENYKHSYYGAVTLRTALENSANIATVKLLEALGYDAVIETARRLGIGGNLRPFPSLALGAFETSLIELTSAYGAFANQGVLVRPHLVEEVRDRDGGLVERIEPVVQDAVSPQIAFLMNRLLAGVISDGTGRAASALGPNLAGKTGTTDENTDAWFIGYSPDLSVGVWVGFDEPESLGTRETGAQAALPIWLKFMEDSGAGHASAEFVAPRGISFVAIDRTTGLKASRQAGCDPVITEAFLAGSEPTAYCSVYQHEKLRLPYPYQRYPLNEQGELRVPADELDQLLAQDPQVTLTGARFLESDAPGGHVLMPLEILPAGEAEPQADPRLAAFEAAEWKGVDGRPAQIVWLEERRPPH